MQTEKAQGPSNDRYGVRTERNAWLGVGLGSAADVRADDRVGPLRAKSRPRGARGLRVCTLRSPSDDWNRYLRKKRLNLNLTANRLRP
jgi:hypothetical protein